ncbi:hypothetical protein MKW98_002900, partial [Papaver atlanticum]
PPDDEFTWRRYGHKDFLALPSQGNYHTLLSTKYSMMPCGKSDILGQLSPAINVDRNLLQMMMPMTSSVWTY